MTEQPEDAGRWGAARPGRRDVLRGVAVVGAFLAVDLGALLYANKWIGPARLTPGVFLDGFAKVFGRHPGFRKNHAKGVAVTGFFDSNGNGGALSTALGVRTWPHTGGRALLIGRRQSAGRRRVVDRAGAGSGVRIPGRRAVADGDAESACFPG